jgi:hypothetical protein
MKKVLVTISYDDPTGSMDWSCGKIKNKVIEFNPKKETIHQVVRELCEVVSDVKLVFKGIPRGKLFRTGDEVQIGYKYRGKNWVQRERGGQWRKMYWDVYVTIDRIVDFDFV